MGGGSFLAYRGSGTDANITWTAHEMGPQTNAALSGIMLQAGVAGGASEPCRIPAPCLIRSNPDHDRKLSRRFQLYPRLRHGLAGHHDLERRGKCRAALHFLQLEPGGVGRLHGSRQLDAAHWFHAERQQCHGHIWCGINSSRCYGLTTHELTLKRDQFRRRPSVRIRPTDHYTGRRYR